jgi:hypothetical protein
MSRTASDEQLRVQKSRSANCPQVVELTRQKRGRAWVRKTDDLGTERPGGTPRDLVYNGANSISTILPSGCVYRLTELTAPSIEAVCPAEMSQVIFISASRLASLPRRSASLRAAARDSIEPTGKSSGLMALCLSGMLLLICHALTALSLSSTAAPTASENQPGNFPDCA